VVFLTAQDVFWRSLLRMNSYASVPSQFSANTMPGHVSLCTDAQRRASLAVSYESSPTALFRAVPE